MKNEGYHGAQAQGEALGDGGPQGKAVSKVVDTIPEDDQPSQRLDVVQVMAEPLPQLFAFTLCREMGNGRQNLS